MRATASLLFAMLAFGIAAPAFAQSADELIAKHVAARGGATALKAISNVSETGQMRVPGFDALLVYKEYRARPGSARIDVTIQGLTAVQAYDGTAGWQIQPFGGRKDPEKLSADDTRSLQEEADFEDALIDYQAKGTDVAYLGTQDVDGAPAYAIRAKLKNGDEQIYYLDPDALLTVRIVTKSVVRGAESQNVTDYGDYEKVDGVWFPFEISSGPKGSTARTLITLDSLQANVAVSPALFSFPQGK